MVDIRTLARHLGLSPGTVSRALSGRGRVSEQTRERVLALAIELGYEANQSARSLRTGATGMIGFMIDSGSNMEANTDNFFPAVFEGVKIVLARHQLDLMVLPCAADESSLQFTQRIVRRGVVDGLIISSVVQGDTRIRFLSEANVPFLALGRSSPRDAHPWVDLDFEGVASAAVDRFAAAGHRRIAVALPDSEINLGHVFHESYRQALERNGIAYDERLVLRVPSSEAGGYQLADMLLAMENPPSAVLLIYELMAVGVYRRLQEAGLVPGKDLSIIGFREWPLARFMTPTLTCFGMSLRDLGIYLAETLLATMPGFTQYGGRPQGYLWPMHLVPGGSDGGRAG